MVKLTSALLYKELQWVRGTQPYSGTVKKFKPSLVTFGIFGGISACMTYNIVTASIGSKPPKRVASDAHEYDRKAQRYSE